MTSKDSSGADEKIPPLLPPAIRTWLVKNDVFEWRQNGTVKKNSNATVALSGFTWFQW